MPSKRLKRLRNKIKEEKKALLNTEKDDLELYIEERVEKEPESEKMVEKAISEKETKEVLSEDRVEEEKPKKQLRGFALRKSLKKSED
ncbi:MAG: hypothetical protein Q8P10_01790 [bacterium]|nr:hypothetical protein [bacterium]